MTLHGQAPGSSRSEHVDEEVLMERIPSKRAVALTLGAAALLLVAWLAITHGDALEGGYTLEEQAAISEEFLDLSAEFPSAVQVRPWAERRQTRLAASESADELAALVREGTELALGGSNLLEGILGLTLAVDALERARSLGLDPATIAPVECPGDDALLRLLVADCVWSASQNDEVVRSAQQRTTVRAAALRRAQTLRAAGGDVATLLSGGPRTLRAGFQLPGPQQGEADLLERFHSEDARTAKTWALLTARWDAALHEAAADAAANAAAKAASDR